MNTFHQYFIQTQKPRLASAVLRAFIEGIIVFVLLVLVDQIAFHLGLTAAQRFADDLLGGAIVGVIIFLDERRRARYLASRLQVIALMNHHVRNALQTIKFAHQTDQQIRLIDESVARIEWALREILPTDMKGRQTAAVSK